MVKDDINNPASSSKKTFIVIFFPDTLTNLLTVLDIPKSEALEIQNQSATFNNDYITKNIVCLVNANTLNNPEFIDLIMDYNSRFIILERHPLFSKEAEIIENISRLNNNPSVLFCGDLDEIIIDDYIEDLILTNYKSFILNKNEALTDNKVSEALRVVQKTLDEKVVTEQSANSDIEWFELNLGRKSEPELNLFL